MIIVGAGLAGLMAANLLPDARIVEASPERPVGEHKALLRFRSDAIGKILGIDFTPVTVNKGVWMDGHGFVPPSIRLANMYSRKVVGGYADRSIWKQEPVTRYIAPENLYERLVERCKGRISWEASLNDAIELRAHREPIINTAPLSVVSKQFSLDGGGAPEFKYKSIGVKRYRIANCNLYQTIYFPDYTTPVYRASITKDLLIVEYAKDHHTELDNYSSSYLVSDAFGIADSDIRYIDDGSQKFGKILPVDERWRRNQILFLSQAHHIYSLGRFATWRNILLDDVLNDVFMVKKLIEGDSYSATKASVL